MLKNSNEEYQKIGGRKKKYGVCGNCDKNKLPALAPTETLWKANYIEL